MSSERRGEPAGALEAAFDAHRRSVWGLCYRMTGCAADADDLLQDTWLRALERPPADLSASLRPWLVRVATNLSLDALRKRRRREYKGSWLPAPVPDELLDGDQEAADARIGRLESATQAFLIALEALSASQRAVLLLRDVYDQSVRDTAAATGLSEPNVKTTLHRARKALEHYEAAPCRPSAELREQVQALLASFAAAVAAHDPARIAALLEDDAELWSDANGEFLSNLRPIVGADPIARFYSARSAKLGAPVAWAVRPLNGLPSAVIEFAPQAEPRQATHLVMCGLPSAAERLGRILSIAATDKLGKIVFETERAQRIPA